LAPLFDTNPHGGAKPFLRTTVLIEPPESRNDIVWARVEDNLVLTNGFFLLRFAGAAANKQESTKDKKNRQSLKHMKWTKL
jgi:hypothetical protein